MSVVLFTMFEMFPIGNICSPRQLRGEMQIEILASRGETVTSFEFPEPGRMRAIVQMGTPVERLTAALKPALAPEVLEHVIRLWSDPDHCRQFEELGRNLLIRDCA
jgi:hypothetical protein